MKNISHFFLSSNSPRGFYSKFNELRRFKCNVIKGCPGCGKSTMMKKILDFLPDGSYEVIHCSSDPDSIDSIILENHKICFVDGTAPHIFDPDIPGFCGNIVNLCKFKSNANILKNESKILKLNKEYKKLQYRAQKYLMSFGAIFSDSLEDIIEKINFDKIEKLAKNISNKIFNKKVSKTSIESTRFIRSIGPLGVFSFISNFKNYKKVYEINDDSFIVSDILLKLIKKSAIKFGYNTILCVSPLTLNERVEAIIFPELKTSIFLSNNFEPNDSKVKTQKIDISNCYNSNIKHSSYNLKIETSLINETIKTMKKAKKVHDQIENIYEHLIDFDYVDHVTENILSEMHKK